ncbi:hypothetical protein GLOTRDRAFT_96075 [Gloeophyllum trabeum ATCC 11539]|uniref:Uncharacterized protein n=1 Tax=Gloeophyllum trabeum (strain ATCC 11539 / FP-39264 / Madison 617) TaxID=670483 RepID=S7PW08_GLOTA|nr:uncharacterized protein GLOTRDRAFT_96075 [Gloeophyllum trabeum ATCC 11539]EPQ51816.1 hypothetical protein GLOTRDRAFT_96075 [Gloeophyllum trabeum ATCC 11539]
MAYRGDFQLCNLTLFLRLLMLVHFSAAVMVNITIDDTYGDEKTGLKPNWVVGFEFQSLECQHPGTNPILTTTCLQGVDSSLAYNQTWTGMTINQTTSTLGGLTQLNLTFNGTAIYVYHVIPAINDFSETTFGIAYSLDEDDSKLEAYSKTPHTQYNQLAYSREGLSPSTHTLGVTIGDPGLPQMFFDYAIYTSRSRPHRDPTNSIGYKAPETGGSGISQNLGNILSNPASAGLPSPETETRTPLITNPSLQCTYLESERNRLTILEQEVERLRAEHGQLHVPPAYDELGPPDGMFPGDMA